MPPKTRSRTTQREPKLKNLPPELLGKIMSKLPPKNKARAAGTSKILHDVATSTASIPAKFAFEVGDRTYDARQLVQKMSSDLYPRFMLPRLSQSQLLQLMSMVGRFPKYSAYDRNGTVRRASLKALTHNEKNEKMSTERMLQNLRLYRNRKIEFPKQYEDMRTWNFASRKRVQRRFLNTVRVLNGGHDVHIGPVQERQAKTVARRLISKLAKITAEKLQRAAEVYPSVLVNEDFIRSMKEDIQEIQSLESRDDLKQFVDQVRGRN